MGEVENVVLVDSKNLVYACHWVHRFLSSKGRSTSVLYGCFNVLAGLAKEYPNTAFVFCWDGAGKTWRHRITNGEYKGNRTSVPEEMRPALEQIPEFRRVLDMIGVRQFCVDGFECDDLIGILATTIIEQDWFKRVIIKSSDKDYYQLVSDRIGVMRKFNKEVEGHPVMFYEDVANEIKLEPSDWVKVKALTGEVTDNIPKIQAGLGPQTAIKMVAAGFDPSVENFKDLRWAARQNFSFFQSQWKKIKMNYELSHILRSWDDKRIDDAKVKDELDQMCNGWLERSSFLRDKEKKTDESFEAFRDWIMEYEMAELFSQRHELWKLP